jgi:hypothetical protein
MALSKALRDLTGRLDGLANEMPLGRDGSSDARRSRSRGVETPVIVVGALGRDSRDKTTSETGQRN